MAFIKWKQKENDINYVMHTGISVQRKTLISSARLLVYQQDGHNVIPVIPTS